MQHIKNHIQDLVKSFFGTRRHTEQRLGFSCSLPRQHCGVAYLYGKPWLSLAKPLVVRQHADADQSAFVPRVQVYDNRNIYLKTSLNFQKPPFIREQSNAENSTVVTRMRPRKSNGAGSNNVPHGITALLIIFIVFLSGLSNRVQAQDPVFTQAFLSPIYLNPAATGTGDYDLRVSGIYRRQWWTIPSGMNYMAASVDKYIPAISGGVGVIGTHSSEGYLNKSGVYGTYAYHICSGTLSAAENGSSPKWFWTGGLQFGVSQTRINYNKLTFADQLNTDGYIPGMPSSVASQVRNGKLFPDFAAGMFFNYNLNDNNRLLMGLSNHHLNMPDESLTNSSDSVRSQLPRLWTGNLLFTHTNLENTWSYSIGGIYYRQANNTSMQAGMEVTQNEYEISLGLWYRGSSNFKNINTFSVSLTMNILGGSSEKDKLRIGVAHDAEIGNKAYSYTAGSSELGFVWDKNTYNTNVDNPCKPKISSTICPALR